MFRTPMPYPPATRKGLKPLAVLRARQGPAGSGNDRLRMDARIRVRVNLDEMSFATLIREAHKGRWGASRVLLWE